MLDVIAVTYRIKEKVFSERKEIVIYFNANKKFQCLVNIFKITLKYSISSFW